MNLLDNDAYVGSPLKKQRASVSATEENVHRQGAVAGLSSKIHEIMDTTATTATSATAGETQNSQSSITNHNTSTTTANNDSLGRSLLSEGIMQSDIKSPGLEEEL